MASIKKRKNAYQFSVSVGRDMNGKQMFKYKTYFPRATTPAAIRKEVELAAAEFEELVKSGKYYDGERITFANFVKQWKENYAVKNLAPYTLTTYEEALRDYYYPVIGNMKLSKITAVNIQNVVNVMVRNGAAPGTVHRAFYVVSGILQKAYKWGLIQENVAKRCELPKAVQKEIRFWTAEQAQEFLKALTLTYHHSVKGKERILGSSGKTYTVDDYTRSYTISRVWREFFNLELHTGMRRGELCGLRWCDIDFEKKTVSVKQVISRLGNGEGLVVKEPKTKSSIRTIAVSKDVIESLKSWRREQMQTCMQMGNYWEGQCGEMFDQNFVFTRPDLTGRPLHPDSVSHKFHEIIQAYNEEYHGNIPDINFHGTRHTSATLLISEGLDVVEVSHRLGHSKTSTTEDIYAHQLEKVDEHAAEVLDSILNKSL